MYRLLFVLLQLTQALPQDAPPKRMKLDLDTEKKITMEFVLVPAGTFVMGEAEGDKDERPFKVTLSKDFWLQTTETTNAQWKAVMGEIPSDRKDLNLPVHCVNWKMCQKFLEKLTEKVKDQLKGLKAGLPTEAQWEYACRAGSKGKWCFGNDEKKLAEYAWYGDWAHYGEAPHGMHPVGQKKPNTWGLFDMHGNMFEWCEDGYGDYPHGEATDPVGPSDESLKCVRGGCWGNEANEVRSANRIRSSSGNFWGPDRDPIYGLRVALR